jgi:pyridoxine 5-phosphate synthase
MPNDMTNLSVNVNKVALLRNSRPLSMPSPAHMSRLALDAGAGGITVHPRPDERHIRGSDVYEIAKLLDEPRYADREFNIEGNPLEAQYLELVEATRPDQCTLVPDAPDQSTSDHGWDLRRDGNRLRPIVARLRTIGCRVSLFIDADEEQATRAAETGAQRVELYTEPYAAAFARGVADEEIARFARAANAAQRAGLDVNAGHDLNLQNLAPFLFGVPHVREVSIGHALIADALELGMAGAVRAYLAAVV